MKIARQRALSRGQFMDKSPMIKGIANLLVSIQPRGWQKVILYANISKNSYEIFFYTKINGKYKKNFELEKLGYGLTREKTMKIFDEIYKLLLPDQRTFKWKVCTFILDKNGKVSMEYDYDTNFNTFDEENEYKEGWKEEYLV